MEPVDYQRLANSTDLTIEDLIDLRQRILNGKDRTPPPTTLLKAISQFFNALEMAIGVTPSRGRGVDIVWSDTRTEAFNRLEASLRRQDLKWPGTVKPGKAKAGEWSPDTEKERAMSDDVQNAGETVETAKKGRGGKLDGMRIYATDLPHTRRAGTKGHTTIQLLKDAGVNGMTAEELEAAGGRKADVIWDLKNAPRAIVLAPADEVGPGPEELMVATAEELDAETKAKAEAEEKAVDAETKPKAKAKGKAKGKGKAKPAEESEAAIGDDEEGWSWGEDEEEKD